MQEPCTSYFWKPRETTLLSKYVHANPQRPYLSSPLQLIYIVSLAQESRCDCRVPCSVSSAVENSGVSPLKFELSTPAFHLWCPRCKNAWNLPFPSFLGSSVRCQGKARHWQLMCLP